MASRATKPIIINPALLAHRKPAAGPLVKPREAISAGLSMVVEGPPSLIGPRGKAVNMVLEALERCGWKIEPR